MSNDTKKKNNKSTFNENRVLIPPEEGPNQPETDLYIPPTIYDKSIDSSSNLVDLESTELDKVSISYNHDDNLNNYKFTSENQGQLDDDPFGVNNASTSVNKNILSPSKIDEFPDSSSLEENNNNSERDKAFSEQITEDDFQDFKLVTPSKYGQSNISTDDNDQSLVKTPGVESTDGGVSSDGFGSNVNTPNNDIPSTPNHSEPDQLSIVTPVNGYNKNSKADQNNYKTEADYKLNNTSQNYEKVNNYQYDQNSHNNASPQDNANNHESSKEIHFRLLSIRRLQDVAIKQYHRLVDYHKVDLLTSKDLDNLRMRYWYKAWDMLEATGMNADKVRNLQNSYNDNIHEILKFYSEVNIYSKAINKSSSWRLTCLGFILALETILYNILNIQSAKGLYDIHFQSMFLYEDDINEIAYQKVEITEPETTNKGDPMKNLIKTFCIATVIYMTINFLIGSNNEDKVKNIFNKSTHIYQSFNKNNRSFIDTINENKDSVDGILRSTVGSNATSMITQLLPKITGNN